MAAGLHSVIDEKGTVHRFFLSEGEEMPKKYVKIYLSNLEVNIQQVHQDQRDRMRRHARNMKDLLG